MKTLQEFKIPESKEPHSPDILPAVLIMKRKSVRVFNSGKKVALYHNDKLGIDIAIPFGDSEVSTVVKEDVIAEKMHDDLFGNYTDALKKHYQLSGSHVDHPELAKLKAHVMHRYGKQAFTHFHAAADHYLNGEVAQASRNYSKFERKIDEEFAEVIEAEVLEEAVIHKIHQILKSKTDGDVVFANGSKHKVSHPQAHHIMKLHTLSTPENKAELEKLMTTPAGIKKIADFAAENLK